MESSPPKPAQPFTVPALPMFSPASVACLLTVHRGTVHNWLDHGKLSCVIDNIGERYVMRTELIRFAREYLGKLVDE